MKPKEYRKLNDKELNKRLKMLSFELIKAKSKWIRLNPDEKRLGVKPTVKKGDKTSLIKQIKKEIARIKTILNERKNE